MDFNEIKQAADKIYSACAIPKREKVTLSGGGIYEENIPLLGSRSSISDYIFWSDMHDLLVEDLELNSDEELKEYYWNYTAELFNRNNGNIGPIKNLLNDQADKLERTYYMSTRPIKCFFLNDTIGLELYTVHRDIFISLIVDLCYLNIHQFEKMIKNELEIYKKFINPEIVTKLDEQFDFDIVGKRVHGNFLLSRVSWAKKTVLDLANLWSKIEEIESVVRYAFVNSKSLLGKVPKWKELSYDEQKSIKNNPASNHHKLYKSSIWMDRLVEELLSCESEQEVINKIKQVEPNFQKPVPNRSLYFISSERINNIAIAECLAHLHNIKHSKNQVTPEAILKKYSELSMSKIGSRK